MIIEKNVNTLNIYFTLSFNVIIIAMTKNELRKYIKTKLEENKASFASESQTICEKLLADKAFMEATVLLAYMPLPDEVDVLPVIKAALKLGKKVAVPRVEAPQKMHFYYLDDEVELKAQVEAGYYGINEPKTSGKQFCSGDDFGNVLVLVPGRAFTKDGARLGRGKGFYDVFLKQLLEEYSSTGKKVYTIGVCFSCQVVDSVPTEPNDIFVDKIVSFSD